MGCLSSLCLAAALATARATPRAVVTFAAPVANRSLALPANVTEVKRYGRRLVVQLGRDIGGNDTEWLAEALGDGVVGVEPDGIVSTGGRAAEVFAADSSSSNTTTPPWNLDDKEPFGMHIQALRRATPGNATVAILDGGVAAAGVRAWAPAGGYDFISSPDYSNDQTGRDADFTDPGDQGPSCPTPSWHGTRVASVLEQIAPGSALLVLRVLGRCGAGFANDVTDAIVWAAGGAINGVAANARPASVISMSFNGAGACPTFLQSAVNQAIGLGAALIAAAGNQAQDASGYFPGNCEGVLAIGATTREGALAPYSNFGPTVAYSAPGGDATNPILTHTASPEGALTPAESVGTSFAAPHVAGMLSLLEGWPGTTAAFLLSRTDRWSAACPHNQTALGTTNCKTQALVVANSTALMVLAQSASITVPSGAHAATAYSADNTNYGGYPKVGFHAYCDAPGWVCYVRIQFEQGWRYIVYFHFICCDLNGVGIANSGWVIAGTNSGTSGGTWREWPPDCYNECVTSSFLHPIVSLDWTYDGYNFKDHSGISMLSDATALGSINSDSCYNGQVTTGFHGYTVNDVDYVGLKCDYLCSCDAGWYYTYLTSYTVCSSCLPCAPGTYANSPNALSCTSCSPGTYSGWGAGSCTACGAGSAAAGGAGSCTACGVGQGTNADQSACVDCPAGWASTPPTWPACYQCGAGTYSMRTRCQQCPAGQWSAAGASACTNCDAGSYSGWEGWIRCNACGAGWSSAAGSSACTQCVAGTSSASGGLCSNCAAGRYSWAGWSVCPECAAGSYSGAAGAATCVVCGQGTYSAAAGATECLPCAPGSASHGGSSACGACYPGTYSGSAGAAACADCVAGKYTGSYGMSACLDCGVGTYSGVWASVCTQCGANRYAAQKGLAACLNCVAGRYSGLGWSACLQCAAGTTSVGGQPCAACGAGQSSQSGDVACSNCAAGTSSASGAACLPCAIGRYSTAGGLCQDCAPGTTATAPGTAACAPCGVGTRTVSTTACGNCSAGHFGWAPGLGACAECAPGTFAGVEVGVDDHFGLVFF